MKGAAIFAAAGGLVATVAQPAGAETLTPPVTAAGEVAQSAQAPAIVGPAAAEVPATTTAISALGFAATTPTAKKAAPKPVVIEDVQVKEARKAAAEARKVAQERASRDVTRRTLTSSTSATKSSSSTSSSTSTNTSTPSASSGAHSSRNWATAGQCTWGALNKWYQSEGYYPGGWTGNAMVWDTGAAAAGYTVSGTPRTRSILVMEPGVHGSSSVGHVAWVTAVNGDQVTIVEMNALAGAYNYNTRTLSDISGMKYIYAP